MVNPLCSGCDWVRLMLHDGLGFSCAARSFGWEGMDPPDRRSHQIFNHPTVHVRQAAVDAVVSHREAFVVDAQLMQNRGVNVVDLSRVVTIQGLVAPFV